MGLFDCDCVCAAPPNYSGVAEANEKAAEYAYKSAAEDLAFRKQVYEESKPQQQELAGLASQVAQQQLGISDQNQAQAQAQWQNYLSTFQPQERMMSADALAGQYLSDADRAEMMSLLYPSQSMPMAPQGLDGGTYVYTPGTSTTQTTTTETGGTSGTTSSQTNPFFNDSFGSIFASILNQNDLFASILNQNGTTTTPEEAKTIIEEITTSTDGTSTFNAKYSPEEKQAILDAFNQAMSEYNSNATAREQRLYDLAQKGELAMENKLKADADTLVSDIDARATEYYDREYGRAMEDEQRARLANEAMINSSYMQQGRDLARRGFDANRIATTAASMANQQALARVNANNQMYGLTAQRLRGADDTASGMRYAAEDQARATKAGAKEQAANKYASLRAGAAAFGRNMPNTAGQAYGLATGAGNSAVGNQNTAFGSGLPYASFVAQGTGNQMAAAGIGQAGALGMGNLLSNDYRTAQMGYGNMESGGGLGEVLGFGLQAYKTFS